MIDDPFGLIDEMGLSLLFDGRSLMEGTDRLAYLQVLQLCLDQQVFPRLQLRQMWQQLVQRPLVQLQAWRSPEY